MSRFLRNILHFFQFVFLVLTNSSSTVTDTTVAKVQIRVYGDISAVPTDADIASFVYEGTNSEHRYVNDVANTVCNTFPIKYGLGERPPSQI